MTTSEQTTSPTTESAATTAETSSTSSAETSSATESSTSKTPEELTADIEKWKAMSRKHEAASNANADKAKRFDALEESQKTELQKVADRATAAEKALAEVTERAMRAEVASAKGITGEGIKFLSGTTKEELEASADALIAFRGEKPRPDFGAGDTRGGIVNGKNDFEIQIAEANKAGNIQLAIRLKEAQYAEANKKK